MKEQYYVSINRHQFGLNICIEDSDGSGTRILGGKGLGNYSTVEKFKLNEEDIDRLIKELNRIKDKLKE